MKTLLTSTLWRICFLFLLLFIYFLLGFFNGCCAPNLARPSCFCCCCLMFVKFSFIVFYYVLCYYYVLCISCVLCACVLEPVRTTTWKEEAKSSRRRSRRQRQRLAMKRNWHDAMPTATHASTRLRVIA